MGMQKQLWTVSGLALELGLDRRTLGKKLHGIKPAKEAGRIKYYYLEDVHKTLLDVQPRPSGSYEEERTRLAKAQADKTELEVDTLRGKLLPADQALAEWQGFAAACRARLLSIPTKTAFQISALKTPQEIERFMKRQIHEALTELASYEPDIESEDDEDA